ncbi:hypothetical protein HDU97_006321 [Phlyctochytrium planicorne]|nr:hypothetical protein HDU97_006321 [Phlyctochytrium planicorne]
MRKEKKEKKPKKDKKEKKEKKEKRHKRKHSSDSSESENDADLWVEKVVEDNDSGGTAHTPAETTPALAAATGSQRDSWMMMDEDVNPFKTVGKNMDNDPRVLEAKRKEAIRKERELNPYFSQGGAGLPNVEKQDNTEDLPKRTVKFGDGGSNWRMMKLKRAYEIAEEESRPIEDVALERYGTLEAFQEAVEEREWLDSQKSRAGSGSRKGRDSRGTHLEHFYSKKEFKKPQARDATVDEFGRSRQPVKEVSKSESSQAAPKESESSSSRNLSIPKASIPSAASHSAPLLSASPIDVPAVRDELNRIQAKFLKAKIMGLPEDASLASRFKDLERQVQEAATAPQHESHEESVVVIPSIDSRGRLQDTGHANPSKLLPGNRKKRKLMDGEDADKETNINEMLLREKMSTGDSYDHQFANQIAKDITYQENLDYMDDRADNFAKKPSSSSSSTFQRQRAITDYKKTQAAQANCSFCWHDNEPPRTHVLRTGTKTYLGLPNFIDMVPYHCLIVPIQHALSTLECEDDVWDEIKNFMKCLIQMHWELGNGVIFIEQVINLKWHNHTFIECIPVPQDKFELAPAYFKEAILSSEEEWSQHRKLIDTEKNGFRRSLTKELPYFHVWFDPKRGYGHVIEEGKSWEEWFGRASVHRVIVFLY